LTLTVTLLYILPDQIISLVLLLIFPTLDSHSNPFVYICESQEWGRLTVRLEKSLGQAVDTNELE
jgi:hypothetical protein